MHHPSILLLPLIIIVALWNLFFKDNQQINYQNNYFQCQKNALLNCQVPTLNQKQCYLSKYNKCPRINGTYQQCTDNSWSYDGVCRCQNRTFEMCPYPYKINNRCYQERMKKCPKLIDEERGIVYESCKNPRINMFHSANKTYKNIQKN